jgi:hypothetical protein
MKHDYSSSITNKILCLKGESVGGKLCKERLTFSSKVIWLEMEETLIIHRTTKPQSSKNINTKKLPADWKSNKKAWITYHTDEWLTAFNAKMK